MEYFIGLCAAGFLPRRHGRWLWQASPSYFAFCKSVLDCFDGTSSRQCSANDYVAPFTQKQLQTSLSSILWMIVTLNADHRAANVQDSANITTICRTLE